MKKNQLKTTENLTVKLLGLLGLEGNVSIHKDQENEAVRVEIEPNEPGILIGHHGETLEGVQFVLGQMLYQKNGEWTRILVDVGDWREKRAEALNRLAQSVASRVKQTGKPEAVYDLTPAERRIVHIELSKDEEVETESLGEGKERHLVVKPVS